MGGIFDENFFLDAAKISEESLPSSQKLVSVDIPTGANFLMYWMGKEVGRLVFDGDFWTFEKNINIKVPLSVGKTGLENTNVPYFVESLMPQAWTSAGASVGDKDLFNPLCGDRYLSNIIIRPASRMTPIIVDVFEGRLVSNISSDQRVFTGKIHDDLIPMESAGLNRFKQSIFERFENYAAISNDVNTAKMSGAQDKMGCFLDKDGVLHPAGNGKPFTHIVKFANSLAGVDSSMGAAEWFSLMLAKKVDMPVEDFALLDIKRLPPAIVVERFDVVNADQPDSALLAEDFCSAESLRRIAMCQRDLLQVMDSVSLNSSCPADDCRTLLKQVVFSWLVGNDDLHLKNLSWVKSFDGKMSRSTGVRLSPVYDVMPTMDYSRSTNPALSIDGSRDYDLKSFLMLADRGGIDLGEAVEIINRITEIIPSAAMEILANIPDAICHHEASYAYITKIPERMTGAGSRIANLREELLLAPRMTRSARMR